LKNSILYSHFFFDLLHRTHYELIG